MSSSKAARSRRTERAPIPRPRPNSRAAPAFRELAIGEISGVDAKGRASVRFPGCAPAGVRARSALDRPARAGEGARDLIGAPVLLAFEHGDLARPVIVGLIRESLLSEPRVPELRLALDENRDVLVDGRRLVLDAAQEILLRCGKSTVLLKRDGKVLIRGAHLVSRSSGPNKLKGGSISLN